MKRTPEQLEIDNAKLKDAFEQKLHLDRKWVINFAKQCGVTVPTIDHKLNYFTRQRSYAERKSTDICSVDGENLNRAFEHFTSKIRPRPTTSELQLLAVFCEYLKCPRLYRIPGN